MSLLEHLKHTAAARLVAAIAFAACATMAAAPGVSAQATDSEQEEILAFFKEISNEAFAVLRDPALERPQQVKEFRDLFKKVTAVDKIGPLLLGHHARGMNPAQLSRYTAVLPDYVVQMYTDRIVAVRDAQMRTIKTYAQGRSDVWVQTEMSSKSLGDPFRADWRIRKLRDGSFSLLDLKVENISLFQTKKDEFMSYIDRNGMDKFLDRIEKDANRSET